MTLDTRQRIQKSQRFFARLASFDLECPACGDVYQIRLGSARKHSTSKRDRERQHPNWDPWTARFTCTNKECHRTYVLGLLAWPIIRANRVASSPPADQVPNIRQLAQMRKEGGGWWLPEEEGQKWQRPLETNLTTETERKDHEDPDDFD